MHENGRIELTSANIPHLIGLEMISSTNETNLIWNSNKETKPLYVNHVKKLVWRPNLDPLYQQVIYFNVHWVYY